MNIRTLRTMLVLIAFLLFAFGGAIADDGRVSGRVPTDCAYWQGPVGITGAGSLISFTDATDFETGDHAYMVRFKSKDTVDSLLWEEIDADESVSLTALNTPTAGVVSDNSRLDPEEALSVNDVKWLGVILQNEDDVSDDGGTIVGRVDFCW